MMEGDREKRRGEGGYGGKMGDMRKKRGGEERGGKGGKMGKLWIEATFFDAWRQV